MIAAVVHGLAASTVFGFVLAHGAVRDRPDTSLLPWMLAFGVPIFFFSSRRRHTRCLSDWSSDVCSSDLGANKHRPTKRVFFRLGLKPVRQVCEVRVSFRHSGNRASEHRSLNSSESFVVAEEEHFVSTVKQMRYYDGPACGNTKLILAQFALLDAACIFKEVRRV